MIKVVMFHTLFFIGAMFSLLNIANAKPLSVTDFKTENHLRDVAFSPDGRYLATLWSDSW